MVRDYSLSNNSWFINLWIGSFQGNCQFRSIAGSLFKNPDLYDSVRRTIVNWLLINESYSPNDDKTKLSDFIDRDKYPSWQDFCEYMANDNGIYLFQKIGISKYFDFIISLGRSLDSSSSRRSFQHKYLCNILTGIRKYLRFLYIDIAKVKKGTTQYLSFSLSRFSFQLLFATSI